MLLRDVPDLSPANWRYRTWFYSKWGREKRLIPGHACFAGLPIRDMAARVGCACRTAFYRQWRRWSMQPRGKPGTAA